MISFRFEGILSMVFLDYIYRQQSYLMLIFRNLLELGWTMRKQGFNITTLLKVGKNCKRLSINKWVMKCQLISKVNKYEATQMPRQSWLYTQLIALKLVIPHSWVNIQSNCEQHSETLISFLHSSEKGTWGVYNRVEIENKTMWHHTTSA